MRRWVSDSAEMELETQQCRECNWVGFGSVEFEVDVWNDSGSCDGLESGVGWSVELAIVINKKQLLQTIEKSWQQ